MNFGNLALDSAVFSRRMAEFTEHRAGISNTAWLGLTTHQQAEEEQAAKGQAYLSLNLDFSSTVADPVQVDS